jgi:hypothetical protein
MDEARVGLIPSYRAVWARKGKRPMASSRRRYQWRYDWAFVHPRSGTMVHFVWCSVDTEIMTATLAAFAAQVGAGPNRRIVLVVDGAGWHTSEKVVIPEGVHLVFLTERAFGSRWETSVGHGSSQRRPGRPERSRSTSGS